MKKMRINGFAAKVEGVYAVDSVPTAAADAVQLEEHAWNTIRLDFLERNERENLSGQDLGSTSGAQPSGRSAEFTVVVALKGTSIYAVPEVDVLLKAAGFLRADATPAANQRTWSPIGINDTATSISAYVWAGGYLIKVVGVRARLTSVAVLPGRIVPLTFVCQGLVLDDPVEAALPAFTYAQAAVKPPVVSSAALTLNGFSPRHHSVTLDMGTEVVALPRGNAAGGHAGFEIVDYRPTLKTTIDNPALASFNPWVLDRNATIFPWQLDMLGGAAFNRWSVIGPAAQVAGLTHEEKDKLAALGITLRLCRDAAALATAPFRLVQT